MNERDEFIKAALQGLLARRPSGGGVERTMLVRDAIAIADETLARKAERPVPQTDVKHE